MWRPTAQSDAAAIKSRCCSLLSLRLRCGRRHRVVVEVALSSRLHLHRRQLHLIVKVALSEALLRCRQSGVIVEVASLEACVVGGIVVLLSRASLRYHQGQVVIGNDVASLSRSRHYQGCVVVGGSVMTLPRLHHRVFDAASDNDATLVIANAVGLYKNTVLVITTAIFVLAASIKDLPRSSLPPPSASSPPLLSPPLALCTHH
jgi:hypothetical protein